MAISDRHRRDSRAAARFLFTAIACLFVVQQATALDGNTDVRDSRQNARTGIEAFSTFWRRESLTLRQPLSLAPRLSLDTRLVLLRERFGSEVGGQRQESENRIYQPDVTLNYRTRALSIGAKGNWFQRRASGATARAPRANRFQYRGWLNARFRGTHLTSTLTQTVSEEKGRIGGDTENRQRSGFLEAQQRLGGSWRFQYQLSGLSGDVVNRETHRTQLSHRLEFTGSPNFSEDRIRSHVRVRSQFFSEEVQTGSAAERSTYLAPLSGGFLLDDTPETQDPLEDDPTPTPTLYDQDRERPTFINLGDSAPVVREFGGDYRNIQFDFGESEGLASAILYVDRRLLLPELYEWRVFVSDDPEGRLWDEVGADRVSVRYNEWGNTLQGWEVSFSDDVTGRYFKMVDVKLGSTVPDLFVTELEVYVRDITETTESTTRSQNHRLEASIGYDVTPDLRIGYNTSLRKRVFDEDSRELDEMDHGLTSRWTPGAYSLTGRINYHTLSSPTRRNTDLVDYSVSAGRGLGSPFRVSLSWNRSEDKSSDRDRTTDNLAMSTSWRAARRLRFNQRVSFGWRRDDVLSSRSRSISLTSSVRGSPVPNFSFDLDRTDRWASQEAGAGFQRFNETQLDLGWSPFPLITLSGDVRYQVRQTTEWSSRQSMTWSPMPGGSLEVRFSGSNFYDSRSDVSRQAVGTTLRWRPRPRLLAEGGVQAERIEISQEESTPVSTHVHVSWSF